MAAHEVEELGRVDALRLTQTHNAGTPQGRHLGEDGSMLGRALLDVVSPEAVVRLREARRTWPGRVYRPRIDRSNLVRLRRASARCTPCSVRSVVPSPEAQAKTSRKQVHAEAVSRGKLERDEYHAEHKRAFIHRWCGNDRRHHVQWERAREFNSGCASYGQCRFSQVQRHGDRSLRLLAEDDCTFGNLPSDERHGQWNDYGRRRDQARHAIARRGLV